MSVLLRILYKTFLDPDSNSELQRDSNNNAQHGHLLKKTLPLSSIRWYLSASLPLLRSLYVVGFARFRYQFYYGFYIKLFSTQIRIPTKSDIRMAYAQQHHLFTKTTSLSSIRRYFFASLPSVAIPLCCRFCTFSISALLRILYKTFLDPDSNSYLKRHSNAYEQQGHLLTKTTSLSSIRRYFFASLPLLRSLYVVGFARFRYQFYYGFYIKLFSTQIRIPT